VLGFDGFLNQRRRFQYMVQSRQRLALFQQTQHLAAAEIFGIGELENGIGRGVAPEQFQDVSFQLGRMTVKRMVQKHDAHDFLLGLE
jgi:hypothetical protein